MKKIIMAFTLLLTLTLTACVLENGEENNDRSPTIIHVGIASSTLENEYPVNDFDLTRIELVVMYSDGSSLRVPLEEAMFSSSDLDLLETIGSHTVSVNYLDQTINLTVNLTPPKPNGDEQFQDYFFYADIPYDGPKLDLDFLDMVAYEEIEGVMRGTGGAFPVTYASHQCIDGDTSRFTYPQEIFDLISSNAKSTRYLNIDTPETWGGGEEEWGKTATVYVCDLLLKAESIILQTDPGDNLLGNFGRLLAWIWIQLPGEEDYFLLNYMIVRQGLGEVAYLFGAGETDVTKYDGLTYTEWMFLAEERAIEDGFGMHGDLLDYYWDYTFNRPHPSRW